MKDKYLQILWSIVNLNNREMLVFDACSARNESQEPMCLIYINHDGQNMPKNGTRFDDLKEYFLEHPNVNYETKMKTWFEEKCDCATSKANLLYKWYLWRFLPSIYVLLVVFGLFANLVVFLLTYQLRQRHIVDVYVISLAAADGLLLLSVIPSIVEKYNEGNFPFGEIGCKLTSFFTYICMICTRFSIVVLALDRFIAVRWPMTNRNYRTVKFGVYLCIAVWIFSLTLSLFALSARSLSKSDDKNSFWSKNVTSCVWEIDDWIQMTPHAYTIFFIARTAITFYIPGALLILFYCLIVLTLVQNQEPEENGVSSLKILRRKIWRTTKVILAVLSSAILCGTPNAIVNVFMTSRMSKGTGQIDKALNASSFTTNAVLYLGSVLNPIIYTFLRSEMRVLLIRNMQRATGSVAESARRFRSASNGNASKSKG